MQSKDFRIEVTLKMGFEKGGFEKGGFELVIQGVKDFSGRKTILKVTEARENTVCLPKGEKDGMVGVLGVHVDEK